MPITLACTCGQRVTVLEDFAGKQTSCPRCGQDLQVPAMGRPVESGSAGARERSALPRSGAPALPRLWAWLAASIGLVLIVAGLVVIINNWQSPQEEKNPISQVGPPEPVRENPNELVKPPEQVIVNLPIPDPIKDENKPPAADPVKEEKKPTPTIPPPVPEIVRSEPTKPYQGGTLTVQLKVSGKPVTFQYRIGAIPKQEFGNEGGWQPARDGLVFLSKLSGPKLIVEFRAVDEKGRPSEVLSRTWNLLPRQPIIAGQPLILEWKLKQGDIFFQELKVVQKPSYSLLGVLFNTSLQYTVLSSFTVEKTSPEGLQVKQKVEAAQLVQADALTQGILAPAILKLPGTTFTIYLNSRMEVSKFTAAAKPFQMANLLGGQGLQLASLLDQDGWKELAELTFFQPNRTLERNAKWSRKMTHNWGALGSWAGHINYTYAGKEKLIHKVAYALDLAYKAPKAGGMLPINNAAFKPQIAGGLILFDAERGKVVEAQERFHVRGRLSIALLGQNSPVDIDENQLFTIRIWDRDPRVK